MVTLYVFRTLPDLSIILPDVVNIRTFFEHVMKIMILLKIYKYSMTKNYESALPMLFYLSAMLPESLNDLFGDDKTRYYKYENIVKIKMTKMMLVIQLVPVLSRLFNNSLSTLGRTTNTSAFMTFIFRIILWIWRFL